MNNINNSIVLADLTALYSARQAYQKPIEYNKLNEFIRDIIGINNKDKMESVFYTLFSQNNPSQINFIKFLEYLGWNIKKFSPKVCGDISTKNWRFSSNIAYDLGTVLNDCTKVLVISDAFELVEPLRSFARDKQSSDELHFAFFRDAVDKPLDSIWGSKMGIQWHDMNRIFPS